MAVPAWPSGVPYQSLKDGFDNKPFLKPIETPMEGGNVRLRRRPGDNVAIIQQSVVMSRVDYETLKDWGVSTIGNWTGRFTMPVWLGSAYVSKVCQFADGAPRPMEYSLADIAASMQLRVFDI